MGCFSFAGWRILIVAFIACALASCSKPPPKPAPIQNLRVAAASSVRAAAEELARAFEAAHPGAIVAVTPGASGTLVAQIRNGAPFDVFLSADLGYPTALVDAGLALAPPRTYAIGKLVLWAANQSIIASEPLTTDSLRDTRVRHIAIANPEHAPYGRAAVAAIKSLGLTEALAPKLVFGENIEQAAQFAQTGAADLAILPRSLALSPAMSESGRWIEIPDTAYEPIRHGAVALKQPGSSGLAQTFVDFLASPEGVSILERHQLSPPQVSPP